MRSPSIGEKAPKFAWARIVATSVNACGLGDTASGESLEQTLLDLSPQCSVLNAEIVGLERALLSSKGISGHEELLNPAQGGARDVDDNSCPELVSGQGLPVHFLRTAGEHATHPALEVFVAHGNQTSPSLYGPDF